MRAEDWDRMPWYAKQRYRARRRRENPDITPPLPPEQLRLTRSRSTWTVYDGVCTAKFGNEAAARWFIRQLEMGRQA